MHTMKPSVSVVIPVHNNWPLTRACLESLASTTPSGIREVIVVDNGSSDATPGDCPALGRQFFGDSFRFIRFGENRNFAPACNAGAQAAQGAFLFFLNNDTLLTPGWLDPLVSSFKDERIGAVGPLLLYPSVGPFKDRVQHLGIAFDPQFYPTHLYEFFPARHRAVRRTRAYQALTAAAIMLRRELFLEIGGFHEEYINGGEDVDLGLKISAVGKLLVCVPDSVVYHLASQTPGRHKHEEHNARLLKERCLGFIKPDLLPRLRSDGYDLGLSPWLHIVLKIPEQRRRILLKRAGTCSKAELYTLMDNEPLLMEIYDRLAEAAEQEGNLDEMLHLRLLQAKLGGQPEHYRTLLVAARRAGDEKLQTYAHGRISFFQPEKINFSRDCAKNMQQLYARAGQAEIAALYSGWLDRSDFFLKSYFQGV